MMEVAKEGHISLPSHLCWEYHMHSTNQAALSDMEATDNVTLVDLYVLVSLSKVGTSWNMFAHTTILNIPFSSQLIRDGAVKQPWLLQGPLVQEWMLIVSILTDDKSLC